MGVPGLLLVVALIGTVTSVGASTEGCPEIVLRSEHYATVHNKTCYLFVNRERYWQQARSDCWNLGGEMLSIENKKTMDFIRTTLSSRQLRWTKEGVWLGARYSGGRWRWTSNEKVGYSNWSPGEPSKLLGIFSVEDCALMRRSDNWGWHDYVCGSLKFHYNYICQFPVRDTTTTSTTTTTTAKSSTTPGYKVGWISGRPYLIPNGYQSDQAIDLRGQEIHSMVLDHSAKGGVPNHPFKQQTAFNYNGRHEPHYASQSQDNGNMAILTIILVTGGIILLILLLVFLIFRRRYKYKNASRQPAVHFDNRTNYTNHANREPMPPPPAPHASHASHPRPVSDMYLTPLDVGAIPYYEEVQRPNGKASLLQKDSEAHQGLLSATPTGSNEMLLGACGGASPFDLDSTTSDSTPLVSGTSEGTLFLGQSAESLHSMSGSLTIKSSNVNNDYVDMNGSPMVTNRCSRETEPSSKPKGEQELVPKSNVDSSKGVDGNTAVTGEGKPNPGPDYGNLTTSQTERSENIYLRLS
ncbi:uncharacterized protein [Littorina saxatilis]|uniref:C-type lectin domain-containing protein n=1 Tax=Littorina saxatilis TaxID=31220 RepID=A0AAN9GK50_9CAEN